MANREIFRMQEQDWNTDPRSTCDTVSTQQTTEAHLRRDCPRAC